MMRTKMAIMLALTTAAQVLAAAINVDSLPALIPRVPSTYAVNNSAILGNLSSLFGWQMGGAMASEDQAAEACSNPIQFGHGKWEAAGLDPDLFQVPLCSSSHSTSEPNDSITPIIHYTTQIFLTQLLASFNDNALAYMCNQVDYFLLDYFLLNDTDITEAICSSVDQQTPPRPFSPDVQGERRQNAAAAARSASTVLYTLLLATGATSMSEVDNLCDRAPDYADNLRAELLNATVYQETMCHLVAEPITAKLAHMEIYNWTTTIFIAMIENISNVDGWRTWLCNHIEVKGMNSAMLLGEIVKERLCDHDIS